METILGKRILALSEHDYGAVHLAECRNFIISFVTADSPGNMANAPVTNCLKRSESSRLLSGKRMGYSMPWAINIATV